MKTVYLIAELANGEDSLTGGNPGNQNGHEARCSRFYEHSNGWKKLYRCTDALVADKIAECQYAAATNGFVGYDTNNRGSYMREWLRSGRRAECVNTPCEADCSSMTYVSVLNATKYKFLNEGELIPDSTVRYGSATEWDENVDGHRIDSFLRKDIPVVRQFSGYVGAINDLQAAKDGYTFEEIYSLEYATALGMDVDTTVRDSDGLFAYDTSGNILHHRVALLKNTVDEAAPWNLTRDADKQLQHGDIIETFTALDEAVMGRTITGGHIVVWC